jgi:hypothetical protein
MRVAGRGDLELGAAHQRVIELAGRAHGAVGNRAVVRGDEVHQAEAERFYTRQGGQIEGPSQRAVGFDQQLHRHGLSNAEFAPRGFDVRAHFRSIWDAADLGQGNERGSAFGGAQDQTHVVAPMRMVEVVNPHAHAAKVVMLAAQQRCHQLRMLSLAAHLRAVFAVERNVEHRPQLLLQSERFQHQLLAAGVVIAGRQDSGRRFAVKQHFGGCEGAHLRRQGRGFALRNRIRARSA